MISWQDPTCRTPLDHLKFISAIALNTTLSWKFHLCLFSGLGALSFLQAAAWTSFFSWWCSTLLSPSVYDVLLPTPLPLAPSSLELSSNFYRAFLSACGSFPRCRSSFVDRPSCLFIMFRLFLTFQPNQSICLYCHWVPLASSVCWHVLSFIAGLPLGGSSYFFLLDHPVDLNWIITHGILYITDRLIRFG